MFNPNSEAIEFPTFRITTRREDNTIIGIEERVLHIIYPSQTLTIADITSFDVEPKEVYTVEFEVLKPDDWNWTTGEFIDFEAINLFTDKGENGYKVTGGISNLNDTVF